MNLETAVEQQRHKDTKAERQRKLRGLPSSIAFTRQVKPNTKSGDPLFDAQKLEDLSGVYASPLGAAGRIYLAGRNGVTVVLKLLTDNQYCLERRAAEGGTGWFRAAMFVALAVGCGLLSAGPSSLAATPPARFDVRDYGAVGDGKRSETAAIAKTVEACARAGGGVVYLPPGKYLSGTIVLKSHVTLYVEAGATILGANEPEDYLVRDDPWGRKEKVITSLVYAENAENVTLTGRGLD